MEQNEKGSLGVLIRCCLCIGGAVGLISNCIGIYYTPISTHLGVGRGDVALMVTLMSLAAAFYAPLFVKLRSRFAMNHLMAFGVVLATIAYLIMSYASSIYIYYLCGIFLGIGSCSFAALPVSIILRDWYGEKNGSKLGIAMAFSGVIAAILNPVLGNIITNFGFQNGFRFMALFLAVICLPCVLTMKLKNESVTQTTSSNKEVTTTKIAGMVMIGLFLAGMAFYGQNGMNSHISALAVSIGYTLSFSATVISFQSIANSVFKFIFGFLADRIGAMKACSIYLLLGLGGTCCMTFLFKTPFFMILGAALYSANFSISTVGMSLLTQKVAKENYANVYSKLSIFMTSSYALMTSFYGFLSDRFGGYLPSLYIMIGLSIFGFIMIQVLDRKTKDA